MKFDCGETREERQARLEKWHPFFCLLPRRIADHDCRWLETIERRGKYVQGMNYAIWFWDYRAKDTK